MKNVALWFVALILVLVIIGGCASAPSRAPACERYAASMAVDSGGNPVLVVDMDNAQKLVNALTGLRDGTCTIPK